MQATHIHPFSIHSHHIQATHLHSMLGEEDELEAVPGVTEAWRRAELAARLPAHDPAARVGTRVSRDVGKELSRVTIKVSDCSA